MYKHMLRAVIKRETRVVSIDLYLEVERYK